VDNSHISKKTSESALNINEYKDEGESDQRGRLILALSPVTSLCIPEIKSKTSEVFYYGFIHSIMMNSLFNSNSKDWERYKLSKELIPHRNFLSFLKKESSMGVKSYKHYIGIGETTSIFRRSDNTLRKGSKLNLEKKVYKSKDIIITDIESAKFSVKIKKIKKLLNYKSIIQIKKYCKVVASDIAQALSGKNAYD